MKFTLKEYQEDAVTDVLINLRKAKERWHRDGDKHAFSLTATTGAGKTVMAAAVFEALFFGDDDHDFPSDPGAVVIWFSDDPSLNIQSSWRLNEASDKLTIYHLEVVENTFSREKFLPGKIYFLNTQKLSKSSLLVRSGDVSPVVEGDARQIRFMPDSRAFTIWDTIQNTIEDPNLTLYLVLDEAHRGMKEGRARDGDNNKPTIIKQLINGQGGVPGIPIVWGISATVERFNEAIAGMQGRATLPNVVVDPKKVQESGLLKDTINLDVPDESGDFSTVLLRRATDKLREISKAWDDYSTEQEDAGVVHPLMVLQIPNSPDHNEIGKWLDTVFDRWPDLPRDCVANVFGEHRTETFGHRVVPYVSPERVQESEWVRILVAKDAISTGWDCPRAEVMISFRAASDRTHITQLLGRMLRTPLARRIPGNERLNAVDCLLPYFNKNSVEAVVDALMTGADTGEAVPDRRILIRPREMRPNPAVSESVWEKLLSLPSQVLPRRRPRPVKRLTALAHELAVDALLPDAGKIAHAEMHKVLDSAQVRFSLEIEKARNAVLTVEGKTAKADVETKTMTFNDFIETADYQVIEDAYRRAARLISPDLATTYSEHLASRTEEVDDPEDSLIDAHSTIAAMGLVPEIKDYLEAEADRISNSWFIKYRIEIKNLSDERRDVFREIKEMSAEPLDIELSRPNTWLQPSTVREAGVEIELPQFEKHMLCDSDGLFPGDFDSWELAVLKKELDRDDVIAWYRNPSRAGQDSLGVVYPDSGELKVLRPDFIFFVQMPDGTIAADIVDPHGYHLADSLPKLRGLSKYAEVNSRTFRRIEAVAEIKNEFRVLDLCEAAVRAAVLKATDGRALYESSFAIKY